MDQAGFEPAASRMQSKRATTVLLAPFLTANKVKYLMWYANSFTGSCVKTDRHVLQRHLLLLLHRKEDVNPEKNFQTSRRGRG